jgi:hypothetical protein
METPIQKQDCEPCEPAFKIMLHLDI